MKYISQIVIDIVLYSTVYFSFFHDNVYANNLWVLIISIFSLIAIISLFANDDHLNENSKKTKGKTSLLLRNYCRYSTIIEIGVLAAIGWWYSSVVFLVLLVYHFRVHAAYEKVNGKPPIF